MAGQVSQEPDLPEPALDAAEEPANDPQPVSGLIMDIPPVIASALVKLQSEVKAIAKKAENSHFKNKYAPLPDVMNYALPRLVKHKLALSQWPTSSGDKQQLVTILMHETGVSMQSVADLLLVKQDPQGLGSALTYMRRQSAMAILGLSAADDDDDGNRATARMPAPTQEQLEEAATLCAQLGYEERQVRDRIASLKTEAQAVLAIDTLYKQIEGRAARIKTNAAMATAAASQRINVRSDGRNTPPQPHKPGHYEIPDFGEATGKQGLFDMIRHVRYLFTEMGIDPDSADATTYSVAYINRTIPITAEEAMSLIKTMVEQLNTASEEDSDDAGDPGPTDSDYQPTLDDVEIEPSRTEVKDVTTK